MGKKYRLEIAESERKGLVDMFRYKPSLRISYEQQGYIYFVSRLYKQLPARKREKIQLLCRETGGPYSGALLEYVTTGGSAEAVCLKHAISRSTLDQAVRRYYEGFSQRIS